MKIFLLIPFILLLVFVFRGIPFTQNSEQPIKASVSCLGLQNPKTKAAMDEFRKCINKFNEERKTIKRLKLIQIKSIDSQQVIKEKIKVGRGETVIDHRIPMSVKKPGMLITRRKFEASEQLSNQIKKSLKKPEDVQSM